MNKINKFSTKRLWLLIRHEVSVRRKEILQMFRNMTLIFAAPFAFYLITGACYEKYVSDCTDFFSSTQVAVLAVSMSLLFNSTLVKSKGNMSQYLTLPASNVEKLLSQILLYTVGIAIMFVASYLVIECLHYPLVTLLGRSDEFKQSIAPIFFSIFSPSPERPFNAQIAIIVTLYIVTLYSIFVNIHSRLLNWLISYLVVLGVFLATFYPVFLFVDKAFVETVVVDGNAIESARNNTLPLIIYSALIVTAVTLLWHNTLKCFSRITLAYHNTK